MWMGTTQRFKLPNGMALVLKASQILGSRPQTLLHGDGHPGNSFVNKATGETTWLDYQCYAKGPPGLDLAQALSLGVLETSKTTLKEMTQAYHKKLCEWVPLPSRSLVTSLWWLWILEPQISFLGREHGVHSQLAVPASAVCALWSSASSHF